MWEWDGLDTDYRRHRGNHTLLNQPGGHKATGLGAQGENLGSLPHALPLFQMIQQDDLGIPGGR